jgi:predicted Holliday junction resolvase-like endonuclease
MTQAPSQNKQIIQKLDEIVSDISQMKSDIEVIKERAKMQPQIDERRFDAITKSETVCRTEVNRQIDDLKKEVKELRDSQTWAYRMIIVTALTSFVGIVLTLANL